MNRVCAKCASDKLIFDVMAIDRDQASDNVFNVAVDENPAALIFRQRIRSSVSCLVCGNCGYIEFYADQPQILYAADQNRRQNAD